MNWLLKYDKLLVALVLAIGIAFMIVVYVYEEKHLTANLTEIDGVVELDNYYIYLKLKPE